MATVKRIHLICTTENIAVLTTDCRTSQLTAVLTADCHTYSWLSYLQLTVILTANCRTYSWLSYLQRAGGTVEGELTVWTGTLWVLQSRGKTRCIPIQCCTIIEIQSCIYLYNTLSLVQCICTVCTCTQTTITFDQHTPCTSSRKWAILCVVSTYGFRFRYKHAVLQRRRRDRA